MACAKPIRNVVTGNSPARGEVSFSPKALETWRILPTVVISSGCYNEGPQAGQLKQQTLISLQLWGL